MVKISHLYCNSLTHFICKLKKLMGDCNKKKLINKQNIMKKKKYLKVKPYNMNI